MKKRFGEQCFLLLAVLCMLMSSAGAELLPALTNRTTLHSRFDAGKLLAEEEIQLILQAAFTMPTGGDQQSLEFYVVTERNTMAEMRGGNPWSQALETASCVIVIAANNEIAHYPELQEMDAGLAAGAMLVQASSLRLTSCVLSISPQEQRISSIRAALSIPETITPILMVAFGYPDADAVSSASVENWEDRRVHWD